MLRCSLGGGELGTPAARSCNNTRTSGGSGEGVWTYLIPTEQLGPGIKVKPADVLVYFVNGLRGSGESLLGPLTDALCMDGCDSRLSFSLWEEVYFVTQIQKVFVVLENPSEFLETHRDVRFFNVLAYALVYDGGGAS